MVHYTGSTGILELRKAIVQRILIDKGVKYDPDEIIVTIGGTEGMFIAIQISSSIILPVQFFLAKI